MDRTSSGSQRHAGGDGDRGTPRLVAHRGLHDEAAGGARENTLAAVGDAVTAGAAAVEVDLRLTRDGVVILLHDATVERLWGDARNVSDLDFDEVQTLGGGPHRIPSLSEALDLVAGTAVTFLLDMDQPAPAAPAVEVVRAHEDRSYAAGLRPARIAWCGEATAMRTVRRLLADAEIWMPWSSTTPPEAADLDELAPAIVNVPHRLVGPAFIDAVHALGVQLSCWTVDDPARVAHLARLGVDSVTTNALRRAQGALVGGAGAPEP